jgi:hypothetical protein
MVRRVLLPSIVLVAATAIAAEPQTKTEGAVKGRQMHALGHLPADSDTVILIPDPLPHLKALLTSEPLRRVMTEGHFAEILKRSPSKITSLDPVLGWDFQRLQKQLLAELKSVRLPRLVVWGEFREAETAAQVLELVRPSVEALVREGNSQLDEQDGGLGVRGRLGDVIDPGSAKAMLVEIGAVADFDDPMTGALAEALGGIQLEVWLERIDSGLRLATGPRPDTTTEHLTAEIRGRELQQRIAETLIEHYYRGFARFRTLVFEEFPRVVRPPT